MISKLLTRVELSDTITTPNKERNTAVKKLIMTAILATVFVAGMAFNASPASATRQDPNKCYEEVTIYGDIIEKETRTRYWVDDVWQNFSPNKDQGTFEGPPSWPTDPRGTWQHQNKDIPGGHQGPDGVYQKGQGNGSWFYRNAGEWGEWGPWTDWPGAGPVNDDGRDRGPAPHGSGDGWERQYRYVVKGQFVKGTKMEEVPCPTIPETTQPPEMTQPPETTQPPVTTAPPETTVAPTTTIVDITAPTAPPTTAVVATGPPPTPPAPPAAQSLPATGNENWVIAALATFALMAGGGLTLAARRR